MITLQHRLKRCLPHSHPLISLGTIFILVLIIGNTFLFAKGTTTQAAGGSFTFTAAGDYGQTAHTTATLTYIGKSGASFDLAIGDLNYGYPGVSASSWSTYVKSNLPTNFPFEIAAGREISRGEFLGGVHQSRGAPSQQEMKHQPHAQRQRGHPPGPVERLLKDLCASFRLVSFEVVGEEHAAGSRGTQLLPFTAHQDAGVTE